MPLYWNDILNSCNSLFQCEINFKDGWKDNLSFSIATTSNKINTWSWIGSSEIDVKPNELYELVAHIKFNKFVSGSHLIAKGFSQTYSQWYQIGPPCPPATAGPIDWHMYICEMTIPYAINMDGLHKKTKRPHS
jgi:hypothetical protein